MTKLLIYVGASIVACAALLVLGFVLSSDVSSVAKIAVLVLCLSVAAFVIFGLAAYRTTIPASSRTYRRLALVCWCLGAAAIALFAAAAFNGLP